MLLRRIIEHLRHQNWFAVVLDLIVVVVGIFLAFQVDRLYEEQRIARLEGSFLNALAEDFESIRAELSRKNGIYLTGFQAAETLLTFDERDDEVSHEEFYFTLQQLFYPTVYLESRTYNLLLANGEIEAISDESLRDEMAYFYTRAKTSIATRDERWQSLIYDTLKPYIRANLDIVAAALIGDPEMSSSVTPSRETNQFREVIGSAEFEAVIGEYWDHSFGWMREVRVLDERAREVLTKIEQNLEEHQ